jgi:hypothetical protein
MLDSLPVGEFTQLSDEQIIAMFEVDYQGIHTQLYKNSQK